MRVSSTDQNEERQMVALSEAYDEFRQEYAYCKDYYGVEVVKIMERNRGPLD